MNVALLIIVLVIVLVLILFILTHSAQLHVNYMVIDVSVTKFILLVLSFHIKIVECRLIKLSGAFFEIIIMN
jgi:hypothetical protein